MYLFQNVGKGLLYLGKQPACFSFYCLQFYNVLTCLKKQKNLQASIINKFYCTSWDWALLLLTWTNLKFWLEDQTQQYQALVWVNMWNCLSLCWWNQAIHSSIHIYLWHISKTVLQVKGSNSKYYLNHCLLTCYVDLHMLTHTFICILTDSVWVQAFSFVS